MCGVQMHSSTKSSGDTKIGITRKLLYLLYQHEIDVLLSNS